MMRRVSVVLLVLGLTCGSLHAAVSDSLIVDSATAAPSVAHLVHRDPPAPQPRAFDADALATLKAAPENQWLVDVAPEPTWWERFLAWLQRRLSDTMGTGPATWFMRNLWVILIIVAVVIAAFTLRKRLFTGAFGAAPARLATVTALHEEVQADDLDARILEAEREGAWRRALRLHYLRALRRLSDGGHITLKPDATDRDYLYQVQDRAVRSTLDKLAFTFQWVWYGEADMDRGRYELLIGEFRRFDPPARA